MTELIEIRNEIGKYTVHFSTNYLKWSFIYMYIKGLLRRDRLYFESVPKPFFNILISTSVETVRYTWGLKLLKFNGFSSFYFRMKILIGLYKINQSGERPYSVPEGWWYSYCLAWVSSMYKVERYLGRGLFGLMAAFYVSELPYPAGAETALSIAQTEILLDNIHMENFLSKQKCFSHS